MGTVRWVAQLNDFAQTVAKDVRSHASEVSSSEAHYHVAKDKARLQVGKPPRNAPSWDLGVGADGWGLAGSSDSLHDFKVLRTSRSTIEKSAGLLADWRGDIFFYSNSLLPNPAIMIRCRLSNEAWSTVTLACL